MLRDRSRFINNDILRSGKPGCPGNPDNRSTMTSGERDIIISLASSLGFFVYRCLSYRGENRNDDFQVNQSRINESLRERLIELELRYQILNDRVINQNSSINFSNFMPDLLDLTAPMIISGFLMYRLDNYIWTNHRRFYIMPQNRFRLYVADMDQNRRYPNLRSDRILMRGLLLYKKNPIVFTTCLGLTLCSSIYTVPTSILEGIFQIKNK